MPLVLNTPFKSLSYQDLILSTPGVTVEGYWRGENEGGLNMTDISTNGHDITRPASTSNEIGEVGGAIRWNGGISQQGYHDNPSFGAGKFLTGWSIEAWIKTYPFDYGTPFPILFVYGAGTGSAFQATFKNLALDLTNYQLEINNKGVVGTTGYIGTIGVWEHVVMTWTTTPSDVGKIYLNGVEVFSGVISDNVNTTFDTTITMGGAQASFASECAFDEVVLYDGVISATDVAAHYNAGLAAG